MKNLANSGRFKFLASAVALALLAACGGGGGNDSGGNGAGTGISVTGTAAKGAMLANATVELSCANGAKLNGTTNASGVYTTAQAGVTYPCVGTATLGAVSYRGVLFAGGVANFTPLTDVLVEVMLAASASGSSSMTLAQFIARIGSDKTFADSVSNAAGSYRAAVLDAVRAQLKAAGKTDAQIDVILAAAGSQAFDATTFALGSALDLVLDNTGATLQNADGTVKAAVIAAAKAVGDVLPVPPGAPTGATGGSGS